MKKLAPEAASLIEMHAQAVELFAPLCDWSNAARVAGIMERRGLYRAKGLPIRQGGNIQERKAAERWLDQLEESGTIVCARSAGKRTHQRLSDLAQWQLTRLVGSYGIGPMLTAMFCLRAHQDTPHDSGNFVPEPWLMGCDYNAARAKRRIVDLEEILAPALVRGWVESNSDTEGRVAFVLTVAGRHLLDNADSLPADADLPEYNEAAGELYITAIRTAREELRNARPSTPGHCVIPLGCGDWPEDSEAADIPPIFAARGTVRCVGAMRRAIKQSQKK